MEQKKHVLVVGGGPGGYVAAIRAAQLGARVTLVERAHLGGTCLNVGCIPTKCLLHSAELAIELRGEAADIGVKTAGVEIDFPQVMAHKNAVTKKLTGGIATLLKSNGVEHLTDTAAFTAPGEMELRCADGTTQTLRPDAIILATGSVNAIPPIPGLRENADCIDSTGALSLEELPASLAVIGGGVIGLELACAYAGFGTKVTVIELQDHVLPMLDGDLTRLGLMYLRKLGVSLQLQTGVESVEAREGGGVRLLCRDHKKDAAVSYEADKVLVAVGRRPNTGDLRLDLGGVAQEQGQILTDDHMRTNVPGVYAIGDCVKGVAQLAHTASAMGEVAAENICGLDSRYDESTNPTCVYLLPEAATVGLTEEEAKARGLEYETGKFPLAANGRALILDGGKGTVKIVAEKGSGRVLGMHIIGPHASDLIAEGALALRMGATVEDLITTIHSHPTVSEAVREAALHVEKRAIHTKN